MENSRSKVPKDPGKTAREFDRTKDVEMHKREILNALVGEQVLHALGEREGLLNVQVRPLWEGHYRVNVFVGVNATSARVAHSYFVVADDEGSVLRTTPLIRLQYSRT